MSSPTQMNVLDNIALRNLMVLSTHRKTGDLDESESENEKEIHWVTEGPELKVLEDKYEGGLTASSLEYPIHLTFHRLILFLEDTNRLRFGKYKKKEILLLMEHALETCYQVSRTFEKTETDTGLQRLLCILEEYDDKHSVLYECQGRESVCHKISMWFGEMVDECIVGLGDCKRYLYLTPMTEDLSQETDGESDTESDMEDAEDKKEC